MSTTPRTDALLAADDGGKHYNDFGAAVQVVRELESELTSLKSTLAESERLAAHMTGEYQHCTEENDRLHKALAETRAKLEEAMAKTAFIDDGIPEAMQLDEHYVWASQELTRRRAFEKAEICRIIGDLRKSLHEVSGDSFKLRSQNLSLTAALKTAREALEEFERHGHALAKKALSAIRGEEGKL